MEKCLLDWSIALAATSIALAVISISLSIFTIVKLAKLKKDNPKELSAVKPQRKKSQIRFNDILISLAFISAIVLVFFALAREAKGDSLDLTILTVSFTLATIVPYIVGNSIAKNEVTTIVDKKFEALENKYSTSLLSLTKQNAHSKRMSANLLKDNQDIKWAIGWASEALISYGQIYKEYDGSKYIIECIEILKGYDSESIKTAKESSEKKNINSRTLRSLITMHAYLSESRREIYSKVTENYDIVNVEKALLECMFEEVKNESKYKTLEEYLKHEDFISFCNNCKISDLIDQDENERIIAKVKYIFDQIA